MNRKSAADLQAMAMAIGELLQAAGMDVTHADLRGTPQRVAAAWQEHFLAGYAVNPATILGDSVDGEGPTDWVTVSGLPCHGLCPHHLLPWTGTATVSYLPATRLVGFGRMDQLVHCFARRLTLQERVCNDVVDALMHHLGARGASCEIEATHACLNVPSDKHSVRVRTRASRGACMQFGEVSR